MHTPSKAWTRSRVPSITLTLTRSVSPGRKSGTGRSARRRSICSCSSCRSGSSHPRLVAGAGLARRPPRFRCREVPSRSGRRDFVIACACCLAPGADPGVMARQQHVGHRAPLPHLRPGVVRVFEQAGGEALLGQRGGSADHARAAAARRRRSGPWRRARRRKHEIAERDLEEAARLDHALVDALVAAAQQHDARAGRELAHPRLAQAARRAG